METTAMAIDTRDGAGASKGYLVAMMAFPLFLLGLHSSLQLIPLPATAFVPHGDVIVAPMSGTALAALRAGTRGPSCTPTAVIEGTPLLAPRLPCRSRLWTLLLQRARRMPTLGP